MLKKCDKCKWKYPDYLLNEMYNNGEYTKPICGICALEISNEGLPKELQRTEFGGEMAEDLRFNAIEWRKHHPQHKPETN